MAERALICGITGQDGALLAKHLLDNGVSVIGSSRNLTDVDLSRLSTLGIAERVKLVAIPLNDPKAVAHQIEAIDPKYLYHLASQSSVGMSINQPSEAVESNLMSTLHLLEAVRHRRPNIRVFVAGSSEAFGDVGDEAIVEETNFRPVNPYGIAKAAAAQLVAHYRETYGIFACTGYLFNHESSLRQPHFVSRKVVDAVCNIANGSVTPLVLGNLLIERDWGWAPEYVEAFPLMLQLSTPRDFVIATGRSCSLQSFVAAAFDELGLDWSEHVQHDPSLVRQSEAAVVRANPKKAAIELAWRAKYAGADVARILVREAVSTRISKQG